MGATIANWRKTAAGLLEVFLGSQRESTRKAYAANIESFARAMNAGGPVEAVADLLRKGPGPALTMAKLYRAGLRNRYAATTVNQRLATLRSLTRTARDLQVIAWRLRIRNLRTTPNRNTAGPGRQAVKRMIEYAAGQGGTKGPRDEAILWLLYGRGLRVGEVAAIDVADVCLDRPRPAVTIWGKGRNESTTMGMPPEIERAVDAWIRHRGTEPGPLFTNLSRAHDNSLRITTKGIEVMVAAMGKAVGVRTSPHGLRHTAITDVARFANIADAQAFSRHTDMATLQTYIDTDAGAADQAAEALAAAF